MRNPNGFGSVVKLGGNRRKPFAVRKTTGFKDNGSAIYQYLGYYSSRAEALIALSKFNENPYDLKLARSTFSEVYELLVEMRFPSMKESLKGQHRASYNYCKELYPVPYADLRQLQFQRVIDSCGKGYSTQHIIRNFLTTMDKLAYDLEIVPKMRTANLKVCEQETKIVRTCFSPEEIQKLWEHQGESYIDETLFMLYTGMRMSEMLQLKCKNVDLEQGILTGGVKTAAGKNRIIPIHSKIRPVIESHLDGEYVFSKPRNPNLKNPEKSVSDKFAKYWGKAMKDLGMSHLTHDCRHTFRTAIDGANKVCIDLIMGHASESIGERIYTHKTIDELKETIELLHY